MEPADSSDFLWELARVSSQQVSSLVTILARDLAAKKGAREHSERARILSQIAAELWIIGSHLEQNSPDQRLHWVRLEKHLLNLENICTWPREDLPRIDRRSGQLSSQLPTLKSLSASEHIEDRIRLSISNFASTRTPLLFLRSYLGPFELFSKSMEKQVEIPGQTRARLEEPDDYEAHVNKSLYNALHLYSICSCSDSQSPDSTIKRHGGRLLLKEHQPRDSHILFDVLFFSTPPLVVNGNTIHWQQFLLHVSRKIPGSKRVAFSGQPRGSGIESSSSQEYSEVIEGGTVCKFLGREELEEVRICLEVQAKNPKKLDEDEPIDRYIAPKPSISLAKALEVYRLSAKMKIVLAYILARSVWQFYESDWMESRWTSDTIHFVLERSLNDGETKAYPGKPFFVFQFDDSTNGFMEYCTHDSLLHRYPRVLALGVLLVQIGREGHIAENINQTQSRTITQSINRDYLMGPTAFSEKSWPDFGFSPNGVLANRYKSVVQKCFDREIFKDPKAPTHTHAEQDIGERRAMLFKQIIYPLKELLEDMGWDDRETLEPMDLKSPQERLQGNYSSELLRTELPKASTKVTQMHGSTEWLRKVSSLNQDIVPSFRHKSSPQERIRIAILDTGYDRETIFFDNVDRKSRIKGWKDWVDNLSDEDARDQDGHGTHSLSLVMKVAPAADLYVARVARDEKDLKKDLQTASDNVAKAIAWAVDECRADIVTMSFGFREEVLVGNKRVISDAILGAVQKRRYDILFFAAAANDGANEREMFPADHEFVFSIRGTNSGGYFQDFNPPPNFDGSIVFGTLGHDVPSAWLSNYPDEVYKSGTSVATPIAAGIAATILGYARFRFAERPASMPGKLWTKSGMTSMFLKMSTPMSKRQYYLHPFEFMQRDHEGREAMMVDACA